MLKILIKKQLLELNSFYFQSKKTGKIRSKSGIIGFACIFAVLLLTVAVSMFFMAQGLCSALCPIGFGWFYYSIMGGIAILFGVFGSVFNTYASLYKSKDNDMLLSMPIKPFHIVLSKIISVVIMSFMYTGLVIVPTVIARFITAEISAGGVILSILMIFQLTVCVTVLTCLLGFLVALLSKRFKNKSFAVVILSVVFIVAYYYVCGNAYKLAYKLIDYFIANPDVVGNNVKIWAYPLYAMGKACEGDFLAFICLTAVVIGFLMLEIYLMARTFKNITSSSQGQVKKNNKVKEIKVRSIRGALFKKELSHFLNSPSYILNCGIGAIFMPVIAIVLLIVAPKFNTFIAWLPAEIMPYIDGLLPVACLLIIMFLSSMNNITAPSISLEGKNIDIIKSLPIKETDIFDAKQMLALAVSVVPTLFMTICICIGFKVVWYNSLILVVLSVACCFMSSALGLALDLKMPNLHWNNEIVPIKQGIPILICMLGTWAFSIVVGVVGYFTFKFLPSYAYLLICLAVIVSSAVLLNLWIRKKGTAIFKGLN